MSQIVAALIALMAASSALADGAPYELKAIGMAESNNGLYKNHSTVTKGLNAGTHAGGSYGLMGLTVKDLIQRFPSLKKRYSKLLSLSPNQIADWISSHPEDDNIIAMTNWKRLRSEKSFSKAAYAWLYGDAGTAKSSDEQIRTNPYVRKVLKNYETLCLYALQRH